MTTKTKVPKRYPEWVCKCIWDSTSSLIRVTAKDEHEAWDKAWKQVSRREGGDSCLRVVVVKEVN